MDFTSQRPLRCRGPAEAAGGPECGQRGQASPAVGLAVLPRSPHAAGPGLGVVGLPRPPPARACPVVGDRTSPVLGCCGPLQPHSVRLPRAKLPHGGAPRRRLLPGGGCRGVAGPAAGRPRRGRPTALPARPYRGPRRRKGKGEGLRAAT